MKRIIVTANVPNEIEKKLREEIVELIGKKEGEVLGIQVTDAPPQGAGATVASVS